MEIDHPMFFVGIGGTGGRIGAQLERRLRAEVRGPDGKRSFGGADRGHKAYELPSCFQFLYLDIDETDLGRLKDQLPGHEEAVAQTMRTASELLPSLKTYADVASYLRITAEDQVRSWLPPTDGEPRVAPLSNGAGQLPTVGRACLFARIAEAGIPAAQQPVIDAIRRLQDCSVDLAALSGLNPGMCDVFVAFSVAGGTGNGMFYDYIHLIADAFENSGIAIQIHPLVVMPSAFNEGAGGGRNAELNAGRGLLDLSRLIDDQNMRDADVAFRPATAEGATGLSVAYRDKGSLKIIQMEASTLQTAFLFSRSGPLSEAAFNESIVSFTLSMAGIRAADNARDGHTTGTQSTFINQGVDRQSLSPSGIGGRGMSTAAVASLTVPRDQILSLLAARLLADAIETIDQVPPDENNEPLLDRFFSATSLTELIDCQHLGPHEAETPRNATTRVLQATHEHEVHRAEAYKKASAMAAGFDPWKGLEEVARQQSVDPFRADRVMAAADRFLRVTMSPANASMPARSGKPKPGEMRDWLNGSARVAWIEEWASRSGIWYPRLSRVTAATKELAGALRRFTTETNAQFDGDVEKLSDDHATARRFLHDLPRTGAAFYQLLAGRLAAALDLDWNETGAEKLLPTLLGEERPWEKLITDVSSTDADQALSAFHKRIAARILDQTNNNAEILPHLADLIIPANSGDRLKGADALRDMLRGLVPTGLLMKAGGAAKVLITYPVRTTDGRLSPNSRIEESLKDTIDIGTQHGLLHYEFRPTAAETLTVVMLRTALGITDIPEARQVMNKWSMALREGDINDALRWRQRLGYDYGWLLTTDEQRVSILQRLLIAMRNGQVEVIDGHGSDEWPTAIVIRASADSGSSAARLELPLRPWDEMSPWADLLHSYEESILAGDELNRQEMYKRLMKTMPARDASGRPAEPAAIYETFLKVQEEEILKLVDLLNGHLDTDQRLQVEGLLDFWKYTVPNARKKRIEGYAGLRNTLEALDAAGKGPAQP